MQDNNNLPSSDEVYVNDGESFENGVYYPGIPKDRQDAEEAAAAELAGSYPALHSVYNWFQEQIAAADSVDNIQTEVFEFNGVVRTRTVGIEAQILAQQILKSKLQEKADDFKEFAEELSL